MTLRYILWFLCPQFFSLLSEVTGASRLDFDVVGYKELPLYFSEWYEPPFGKSNSDYENGSFFHETLYLTGEVKQI
jgi:hypothetical protein